MKFRITILVFLALLIGIGSNAYAYNYNSNVVNKGRYYCTIHTVIYEKAGSHQNCTRQTLAVGSKYKYCSKCNTKYPVHMTHSCPLPVEIMRKTTPVVQKKYVQSTPVRTKSSSYSSFNLFPIKAFIRIEQRPVRYRVIRQYSRYGNDRTYYNLSGRNYFRQWFGKSHHRRDHHERRRHRDRHRY